jgi:hypothetical protein
MVLVFRIYWSNEARDRIMLNGLKILTEYVVSVTRVFLVFTAALFLPWAFLYQIQTYVADGGKVGMRIVQNERGNKRIQQVKAMQS